ncbi:helix-turn-helix domain-containing protein [Lentzea sp. NBC_00516]|uniref:helix-turn-helix domain-containing protein n=1 Tax=Lentzea sp. NBC_00516 TaxID=2903582 RepID=UPI002E801B55|nr:helix-turn-helix transcriptional regulator [Lentzea sp. NBC_00516]WUD28509.1 helix-turn-helix domain-containing protein [Lentzea sp. NBC_00516]
MNDHASARQVLARELKRLRLRTGLSGRELGRRASISQSKVSRIEAGTALPTVPEVENWGRVLDVPAETVRWLAIITGNAHLEAHSWSAVLQDGKHLQHEIGGWEAAAAVVRTYQPSVVPGLLQIADYARRVFSLFSPPYDEAALAAAVAGRLERQLALYESGRKFEFLITEAALRWRPGPPNVLVAQLDRIRSMSTLDNIGIGLIPLDGEAVATYSHGFVIYEGGQESVATVEMIHGPLTVDSEVQVEMYRHRWSLLGEMALRGDDARSLLDDLIGRVRRHAALDGDGTA